MYARQAAFGTTDNRRPLTGTRSVRTASRRSTGRAASGRCRRTETAADQHAGELWHCVGIRGARRFSCDRPAEGRAEALLRPSGRRRRRYEMSKLHTVLCPCLSKSPQIASFSLGLPRHPVTIRLPPPRGETYRWKRLVPGPWQGPAPSVATLAALP